MELGSQGEGVTGVPHDSRAAVVFYPAGTATPQMRQGQHGATTSSHNFIPDSFRSTLDLSQYNYNNNNQFHADEAIKRNGGPVPMMNDTTAVVRTTKPADKSKSTQQPDKKKKSKKKQETPIPQPGFTFDTASNQIVPQHQQQQHQQQQHREQQYQQNHSLMQQYSGVNHHTSGFQMNMFPPTPQQADQYMQQIQQSAVYFAGVNLLAGANGGTYSPLMNENNMNGMPNSFQFPFYRNMLIPVPPGTHCPAPYSQQQIHNGQRRESLFQQQVFQQQQSQQQNPSFALMPPSQQFQNSPQMDTAFQSEMVGTHTVPTKNDPTEKSPTTGTFSPINLPCSTELAEKTIGDNPIHIQLSTSPTPTDISEFKIDQFPPEPLATERPEKTLPSPPAPVSLRGNSGKKSARIKKNKVVFTKKQRPKNTKKRSRSDKISARRGQESEEETTIPKSKQQQQQIQKDVDEDPQQEISTQCDSEVSNIIVAHDDSQHRYVNPLLEMPPFPGLRISNKPYNYYRSLLQSLDSSVCSADPVNASEILSITQIYFPRPDTFPLRYLARLLGFKLSFEHNQEHLNRLETEIQHDNSKIEAVDTDNSMIQEELSDVQEQCRESLPQKDSCNNPNPGEASEEMDVIEADIENSDENFNGDLEVDKILTNQLKVTRISSLENDPAMDIPTLGFRCPRESESVVSDDVEDLDPVWKSIKQYYKGYSKSYFSPVTAANTRNMSKIDLSIDCLKFAQDLKIAPLLEDSSISFRFATIKDEVVLKSAVCKENSDYLGFRQLKNCDEIVAALKAPCEFFILAFQVRDKSEFCLGFIHYCFHWYRLQGDAAQLSEVVMYLNEVGCSADTSDNLREIEKEALEVMLVCHAFEHARACGIYYGMMNVSKKLSARYINLFRMTELPHETDNNDNSMSLLAFALDKYSHRYALRMLKSMLATKSAPDIRTPTKPHLDKSYRMLIKIPSQAGISASSLTRSERKGNTQSSHASSANSSLREKSVVVRFNKTEKTISCGFPCERLNDVTTSEDKPWSVVRLFPRFYPIRSLVQTVNVEEDKFESESDDLRDELLEKQKQLRELENELEPRLYSIFRQAVKERVLFTSKPSLKDRAAREECLENYQKVLDRKKAAAIAWQLQQEQDMDAVCDICNDGEVSVNNQILFCESCNVAVHQICYGIKAVPAGDWFCRVCRYFNRHEVRRPHAEAEGLMGKALSEPLPISCEVCPRRQGAFVRTHNTNNPEVAKWVHVVCAKWLGINYLDIENPECVDSVLEMKYHFRSLGISCFLCKGMRGAYHKCNAENCDRYMHLTCARSIGSCSVVHGETAEGLLDSADAWKLKCPEHSGIATCDIPESSLTVEELVASSKHFPSDPLPPPPKPSPKIFSRLQLKEREELLKDEEFEADLIKEAAKRRDGAICEICYKWDGCSKSQVGDVVIETGIVWCNICGISVHKECYAEVGTQENITRANFVCAACTWVKENSEENEVPQCHLCNMKGGPLRKAYAVPVSMSKWNKSKDLYKKTAFGRQIWCHSLCAIWNPQITVGTKNSSEPDKLDYNCTMVIMSNGFTHINEKWVCALCCRRDKVKVRCVDENCNYRGTKKPFRFHLTCARQAGFQIADEESNDCFKILALCFAHKKSEFSIRAQLEDFVELEKSRVGKNLPKGKGMTLGHFARLLQMAVKILSVFGWAWRWAEWWVDEGGKWEPVVEEGEQENMISSSTVIESTPESRCADARRCRLAALGAALRNRDYDKEKGDDRAVLDRALRAVLHTPSLVGPLKEVEIDFIAEWLGRAYRSKDRLLGFGDDKIAVLDYGESLHSADLSPKFELGSRPLPGKQVPKEGEIFETDFSEVDDFMLPMDPLAELRGKKVKTAKRKEEKKKESPSKRIRFSKRSLDQDSSLEREPQNNHLLDTKVIGQQVTGTEITLDEPVGDNHILDTSILKAIGQQETETKVNLNETIEDTLPVPMLASEMEDNYSLQKMSEQKKMGDIRKYLKLKVPRRDRSPSNPATSELEAKENNDVGLIDLPESNPCISKNETCMGTVNKEKEKILNDQKGLDEEANLLAESSVSMSSTNADPSVASKNMNFGSSCFELNASTDVQKESNSNFEKEDVKQKDVANILPPLEQASAQIESKNDGGLPDSNAELIGAPRKRGRPKKAVSVEEELIISLSKPHSTQTKSSEESKKPKAVPESGVGDIQGYCESQSEEGDYKRKNDSLSVVEKKKKEENEQNETKSAVTIVVGRTTRRTSGPLEGGENNHIDDVKQMRQVSPLRRNLRRVVQEADESSNLSETPGTSTSALNEVKTRSEGLPVQPLSPLANKIKTRSESLASQHLSPSSRLKKALEVHGVPRKKKSRLTTQS